MSWSASRTMRWMATVLALGIATARAARAQAPDDTLRADSMQRADSDDDDVQSAPARAQFARCQTANRLVRAANTSLKELWAYGAIAGCPDGAAAMAEALVKGRDALGPFALDSLTKSAWHLNDAQLLDAALDLAVDQHEPALARALALRVVVYALRPTVEPVLAPALVGAQNCAPREVRDAGTAVVTGTPVSDEQLSRARSLANRMAGDDREPASVRAAAACALGNRAATN